MENPPLVQIYEPEREKMPVGLYRKKRLRYHHPIMKTDYGLESPFPSEKAAFLSKSGRKTAVLARGKKETKNEEEAFLSVLCPGCSGSGDSLLFFISHRYQQSNRILCGRKLSADSFLFVGDLSSGRFIYMGCPVGGKKRRGQRRGQFFFVGSQQRIMRHTAFDGRVVRGMANGIAAFFAGSSSNSKAFTAGTGLLFFAGGSIVVRLLHQNLHIYRYSRSLLWISLWSAFRLVTRFGQLPMAFRMPQRLLEILMMTAQCLFLLAGSHLICNVIGKKSYRWALFSGHAATALGLIWCVCPLVAGNLALSDLSQMLNYWMEWGLVLFTGLFCFFITPADQKTKPAV